MKTFIPLENNPTVMTPLAHTLGLSPTLSFHDVYSLTDPDLLSLVPRPAHALLVTIPMTPAWRALREIEDEHLREREEMEENEKERESSVTGQKKKKKSDDQEQDSEQVQKPVLWFKQTIRNACGLIALIHCALNGSPATLLTPDSEFARLLHAAPPLDTAARAHLLEASDALEAAHGAAAITGATAPPDLAEGEHVGNHFVAFVKGKDGHLWELEGSRRGALDRGPVVVVAAGGKGEGDGDWDVLSPGAVEAGIGRYVRLEEERGGGRELRFSCLALGPRGEGS